MNPRVTTVKPGHDYTLQITFNNGEEKSVDVNYYLDLYNDILRTDKGIIKKRRCIICNYVAETLFLYYIIIFIKHRTL